MSMATLERAILAGARALFQNPKLRQKDIVEWSTSPVTAQEGEVAARVDDPGVYVAIKAEHDRRKEQR